MLPRVQAAAFYMDPGKGPSGRVTIAQLTVLRGVDFVATLGMQGRAGDDVEDWREENVRWSFTSG